MVRKSIRVLMLVAVATVGIQMAQAQADEKKVEIGGQFSFLRVPTLTTDPTGIVCGPIFCPSIAFTRDTNTDVGFGPRIGYNATSYLTLEAEMNFFPQDRPEDGGQKFQGLFGAKVGQRFEKVGVFAKARPGFVRLSKGEYQLQGGCVTIFPPPIACFQPNATTHLAFDLGGVAEFYPSKNTIIRFDAGDTMIRFKAQRLVAAVNPNSGELVVLPAAPETKHNFQGSIGVGFRF